MFPGQYHQIQSKPTPWVWDNPALRPREVSETSPASYALTAIALIVPMVVTHNEDILGSVSYGLSAITQIVAFPETVADSNGAVAYGLSAITQIVAFPETVADSNGAVAYGLSAITQLIPETQTVSDTNGAVNYGLTAMTQV
jgi:hypothetical protein